MYIWFLISITGVIAAVFLHFLSVEHIKLKEKHGKKKGIKIGERYGLISGWFFFLFWIGIWISPQPRFTLPIFQDTKIFISFIDFSISLMHFVICTLFLIPGAFLGIKGVRKTSLKVAETHRAEKIVTTGVYSMVRHPQYLGGLLAHVGISFLLSAWYSLLVTPLMIIIIFVISWKEEKELIKEFGKEYKDYKKKTPMLIPGLKK